MIAVVFYNLFMQVDAPSASALMISFVFMVLLWGVWFASVWQVVLPMEERLGSCE